MSFATKGLMLGGLGFGVEDGGCNPGLYLSQDKDIVRGLFLSHLSYGMHVVDPFCRLGHNVDKEIFLIPEPPNPKGSDSRPLVMNRHLLFV